MDAISAEQSVYLDGQWLDALWMVETVDGESGEMVITATVAGPGAPHVAALRMSMELVRQLRSAAGFVEGVLSEADWLNEEERLAALEERLAQTDDALTRQYAALVRRVEELERGPRFSMADQARIEDIQAHVRALEARVGRLAALEWFREQVEAGNADPLME